ncbi:S8 family serine peptidase [Brevundimonas sp. M20]|uniref:S8 family serine peptidase n=1 Tax=Brevundimonas sp. M20 TaxID=2591463 RepID=UPI001146F03A|nr:S8 family serine peptidase [Brevundimonas sp. M20]QDH72074.1 S8 family serine peptidase [Brevundimonas sp. M20]
MRPHFLILLGCAAALVAGPASAQIGLPGGGGLPSLPGARDLPGRLPGEVDRLTGQARDGIEGALQVPARFRDLVRRSDGALESDPDGWAVVRGEIVAVTLSPDARRAALAEGFTVIREERLEELDLTTVVLAPPRRMSPGRAMARLKALAPDGEFAFNHVYVPAGDMEAEAEAAPVMEPTPSSTLQGGGVRVGLIDTGVDAGHPALAGVNIQTRGFVGTARPAAHGTAVASLLVGRGQGFHSAAPGASLYAADVYGGAATGGSATAVAQALSWLSGQNVRVVNISLVGPRNGLIETAIARARQRGMTVVAAVGNDGPAAPPLFPASYPGVIGVTAVNARNRVLPEAGRGPQVDFAAPGADMAAAGGRGWVAVRGASFAAPLVAGLLARNGGDVEALARTATDEGAPGADPVYGRGVVAGTLRTAPAAVGARGQLAR